MKSYSKIRMINNAYAGNKLQGFVVTYQAKLTLETRERIQLGSVIELLAEHCGVSVNTIKAVYRGVNQPSLPLALLIAEFFHVKVEDIFPLERKVEK